MNPVDREPVDDVALALQLTDAARPFHARRQATADRALCARSPAAKVHWLREEAALVAQVAAPFSPCRAGCAHCCHQAVAVAQPEAEVIARETGATLRQPAPGRCNQDGESATEFRQWEMATYTGTPCVFLVENRCSIYAHRPVACRTHISVERDAEPCRIENGSPAGGVRYINVNDEQRLYVMTFADNLTLADIRDWFPQGL